MYRAAVPLSIADSHWHRVRTDKKNKLLHVTKISAGNWSRHLRDGFIHQLVAAQPFKITGRAARYRQRASLCCKPAYLVSFKLEIISLFAFTVKFFAQSSDVFFQLRGNKIIENAKTSSKTCIQKFSSKIKPNLTSTTRGIICTIHHATKKSCFSNPLLRTFCNFVLRQNKMEPKKW